MDLIVPGVGELIGGSQREERYEVLLAAMQKAGLEVSHYQWYVHTRMRRLALLRCIALMAASLQVSGPQEVRQRAPLRIWSGL